MAQFLSQVLYGEDLDKNRPPAPPAGAQLVFSSPGGERFGLSDRQLSTHLLLLGSTGCGKSSVMYTMLDQLLPGLGEGDLMVVFDADGSYAARYFDPQNPRHLLVGFGPQYAGLSHTWNIFGELAGSGYRAMAHELAKGLLFGHENRQQPFFTDAPRDLIRDVLLDRVERAVAAGSAEELTTRHFLRVLRGSRLEDWLALTEKEGFRAHRMYFGDSGKLTPQALGVFGELNAAIEDTFGAFPEEGGRGEFSMRELVEEKGGRVLFLEYDIALGEGQQPLFRLWFDLGLKFSLGVRGENRGRTFFICDELSLLPDLRHLADALNFGRSRGVRMLCALQSVNQFCDAYGPQADSILAGFCSCFGFRCYDDASRTYLSKRLGKQYATLAIRTAGGQLAPQAREGRVAEDWVVRALATGEALVDLAGDDPHPFRFRFSPHP